MRRENESKSRTNTESDRFKIIIIVTLDYFGIPEDKAITTGQEPCAVMGDEVVTMNECYEIMLNNY